MNYNVLWTGGWDSTYRILDLVLNKKQTIQPYYVKDTGRKSTSLEIETMEKIKNLIYIIDEDASTRILDTIFIEIEKIPIDLKMKEYWKQLLKESHLGSQYYWLSSYVIYEGISNIELCIHKDDKAEWFIRNNVSFIEEENGGGYYKLSEISETNPLNLFSSFTFPLLSMTKTEMGERANANGFAHIMEVTWFCFNPTSKGTPCGICNPCLYTREEGLGRRVPKAYLRRCILRLSKLKGKISKKLKSSCKLDF